MPPADGTDVSCPVCGVGATAPLLRRAAVPVHQNLLCPTPTAARAVTRGDLDLWACRGCGFVFNAAFDLRLLDYGPAYENSQDHSPAFTTYLDELVERIVSHHGVRSGRVVEVGCGKGAFLARLLSHPENRCEAVGFDPSYIGPEDRLGGRVRFVRAFYGPETALPADAVVCRHVIEHVPDPVGLLRAVRAGIGDGPAKVFVETPCVGWIVRNRVPWDLFYEHCSLFSDQSLELALERAGFAVTAVRHVFGGQYLWAEAIARGVRCADRLRRNGPHSGPYEPTAGHRESDDAALSPAGFAADERRRVARWAGLLDQLRHRGPVAVWGAGAKGVTFCNLADPTARRVAAVIDVNPAKQGRFLPGTGHPIVAPDRVVALGAGAVLVLNPNYTAEVATALTRHGSPAALIDLMAWEGSPCG